MVIDMLITVSNKMNEYEIKTNGYTKAIMSNTNNFVAVAGKKTYLYKFPELEVVYELSDIKNPSQLCFSNDDNLLAVKSTSGIIGIIDVRKGEYISKISNIIRSGDGSNLMFTSDDKYLCDGDWEGNFRAVNVENGEISYIEKNKDLSITKIEYEKRNQIFHIQKYYRGGYMDKSYSTISRWKYDPNNEEFILVSETQRRYNYSNNISYNSYNNNYYTINYVLSNRSAEVLIYDNMLEKVIFTQQIDRKVENFSDSSVVTNDGKYFILLIDNNLSIYNATNLEFINEYRLSFCNYISSSSDGKHLLITDFSVREKNTSTIKIISLVNSNI